MVTFIGSVFAMELSAAEINHKIVPEELEPEKLGSPHTIAPGFAIGVDVREWVKVPENPNFTPHEPDVTSILTDSKAAVGELPIIRRRASLLEGDEEQYQIALSRPLIGSTKKNQDINSFFVNPPKTDGMILPLRDVIIFTLKNNPDIAIARWRTEDARFAIRAARAPVLPQVEVAGASGVEGNNPEKKPRVKILHRSEVSLRASQTLFDFGRAGLAIRRAKALHQSRALQKQGVVEETVFVAVSAYLDLLAAEQLVESSTNNVAAHERIVALVKKNVDAGNLSEAEIKRAQTRLDRAKTNAIDLENRRERAMGSFRRVTGLEPTYLSVPSLDIDDAYNLTKSSVDQFLEMNPALQAALRDINSLDHQIAAAGRASLPEVSLQLAGAYKQNVLGNEIWTSDARAMIAASWQAYDGGAASSRRSQLIARKNEAELILLTLRNELRQDAFNIISVLKTSRDKRKVFKGQLESSERVVELYEKQFEAGRRSLLELLDAQVDLAVAREENIVTKYENLAAALASLRLQNSLLSTLAEQLNLPSIQSFTNK